jgi:peptidoglycan/LPS O-acetylase OafA/YrhL
MTIFWDKKMDLKMKVIIFIVIVIISGLPMWLSTYTQYLNHLWITGLSTLLCAICAGIIAFKTNHKKRKIVFYVVGAHQVALLVKIVIDCIPDKTNHDLAPFEMLMLLVVDLAVISIAVIVPPDKKEI